ATRLESASVLDRAARMQFGALAGHYQSHHAKHRCGSLSMDHSTQLVPAEFHFVLWKPLVSSNDFSAVPGCVCRRYGLCSVSLYHVASFVDLDFPLLRRAVLLLHVLPWRTGTAET